MSCVEEEMSSSMDGSTMFTMRASSQLSIFQMHEGGIESVRMVDGEPVGGVYLYAFLYYCCIYVCANYTYVCVYVCFYGYA
jgi:hypothetical protein